MVEQMERDKALMWLNDHVGKTVRVALSVDHDGWSAGLIDLTGLLKHVGPGLTAEHGDELVGTYTVGDEGGLDLTELPDDEFSLLSGPRRREELRIDVGENAGIGITALS